MNSLDKIRGRITDLIWGKNVFENIIRSLPTMAEAEQLYADMCPGDLAGTWCWNDIDYSDQTRSNWLAVGHQTRMLRILLDFGKERLLQDEEYARKMVGALEFWVQKDFQNPNWWHNEIGTPRNIANLVFLLDPVLEQKTIDRAAKIIARGSLVLREREGVKWWTGANLIWGAFNTMEHALIVGEEAWFRQAVAYAEGELCNDRAEGIQPDGSFFQHGPRLYSGGYGRSYAYDIAQIAYILQETEYQFSQEKLQIFLTHILDGLRHMTQGNCLDWSCIGREFARVDAVRAGILERAVFLMARTADMPRQEELQAYWNELQGQSVLEATKYFSSPALLCHHTDGIYIGARFLNDNVLDSEICNEEAELCYNMSYGTHTCIMRDGEEYVTIEPVWDFSRVPGTTSRTETDEQLLAHREWWSATLPNSHFGGGQQGKRAVIYELAQHDGIDVLAADFAFEGGFVCMGAGITDHSETPEALVTTVDQCLLRGTVTEENGSVIHNGIRYTALEKTKLAWESKHQTGNWQRNNFGMASKEAAEDVLTLTISHPVGKESEYAYLISAANKPAPAVEILRNDCEIQAIRLPDGGVLAVFHQDGELEVDGRVLQGKAGVCIESGKGE